MPIHVWTFDHLLVLVVKIFVTVQIVWRIWKVYRYGSEVDLERLWPWSGYWFNSHLHTDSKCKLKAVTSQWLQIARDCSIEAVLGTRPWQMMGWRYRVLLIEVMSVNSQCFKVKTSVHNVTKSRECVYFSIFWLHVTMFAHYIHFYVITVHVFTFMYWNCWLFVHLQI